MPIKRKKQPTIVLTLGDPAGIGPEVIAKALKKNTLRQKAKFVLLGDGQVFKEFFPRRFPECDFVDLKILNPEIKTCAGSPTPETAQAALAYLKKSVELVKGKNVEALVTGPLSKETISAVLGQPFQGHTEYLAESFGVKHFEMMFVSGDIRTVVVTRHIPLAQVSNALTTDKILNTIRLTNASLKNHFKIHLPKIAVCGLNPHAGEGGKMGVEEIEKISPAVSLAQMEEISVQGPFPADTIFCPELMKRFDVVIAMYHDQGIIPVKTVAFNSLVNMTIGLPFIRTSPAHGTAFNIAGKNCADPSSMVAAIELATKLATR